MEKENRFLKDFGKALLGLVPATRVGVSMFTPEAQEAICFLALKYRT